MCVRASIKAYIYIYIYIYMYIYIQKLVPPNVQDMVTALGNIDFHSRKTKNTMEVNGAPELLCFPHSSEYLPLCSAEQRHSYRFGTT